jgi:hypothetical protein
MVADGGLGGLRLQPECGDQRNEKKWIQGSRT